MHACCSFLTSGCLPLQADPVHTCDADQFFFFLDLLSAAACVQLKLSVVHHIRTRAAWWHGGYVIRREA